MTRPPTLASDGGPRAFPQTEGQPQPKVGVEEFLSLAHRFGFNEAALSRLRAAVSDADLPPSGPDLARYLSRDAGPSANDRFEALARTQFGVSYAWACSSGTGALHCALAAAGVKPGTEVIVPALGFIATAVAVVLCGGQPVFVDVDDSLQMDPRRLEALISPRTVALMPTHHWGGVCDMEPIMAIARRYGLTVVEDCAQAPGATYRGRPVGSIGDIGCFSISAYKIIGGGEGGLVVTNDQRLYERMEQFGEGGGLWRPERFAPARYEGELFVGTNYRLSELEAAVDLVQLAKLPEIVARYRRNSRRILAQQRPWREILPQRHNDRDGEIGYLLRFFPADAKLAARLAQALAAEGLPAHSRSGEEAPDWHAAQYMFPLAGHADLDTCPVGTDLFNRACDLDVDQWWTAADCDRVAAGLDKVLAAYCTPAPAGVRWL